jgi:nucleotide-binding universal stress UspA family protein
MFDRILVPIDGSSTSSAGLDEAIRLAKLTGGTLRLVHVLDELAFTGGMEVYGSEVLKRLREAGQKVLAEGERVAKAAGMRVETKLFESYGDPLADLVAKEAVDWPADLIVIGTHGRRGLRRALLGSDAEQIARHATVPVLLLRPRGGSGAAAS